MRTRPGGAPRLLMPLSLFVVAVVVAEAALGSVGFGSRGTALLLSFCALLYILSAVGFFAFQSGSMSRLTALGGMAASAIGLHVADPTGPVIGLFLVAALTPVAGYVLTATALFAVAVLAYNAVQIGLGSETLIITIATDAGCAFFYLFGTLLRTERAQREAVSRLLEQLEASRAAEREASRLAERATLARELHDVLAHSMSGLVIQLSGARLLADTQNTDPRLVEALDKADRLARGGLDEARRAVRMLRGEALPGLDAVDRLLQDHTDVTGTEVDWREVGDPTPVSAEVELAVYRWVQENLSNVRKHASGSVAHLHLTWDQDHLVLEAWNELGADAPTTGPTSGYGLRGMAERAHSLGGTFDVDHSAQRFRTVMRLPLKAQTRDTAATAGSATRVFG